MALGARNPLLAAALAAALVVGAGACRPGPVSSHETLAPDLAPLPADFNRAEGQVRVVMLVAPS